MQTLYSKIKNHFERYTNADVVFVSGGKLFLTQSAAESYGTGVVMPFKRDNFESILKGANTKTVVLKDEEKSEETVTEEVEKSLLKEEKSEDPTAEVETSLLSEKSDAFTAEDVELMNYNQMRTKVAELGIEVDNSKKETLKEALLSFVKQ
jgi:hypothetical protein